MFKTLSLAFPWYNFFPSSFFMVRKNLTLSFLKVEDIFFFPVTTYLKFHPNLYFPSLSVSFLPAIFSVSFYTGKEEAINSPLTIGNSILSFFHILPFPLSFPSFSTGNLTYFPILFHICPPFCPFLSLYRQGRGH